MKKRPKLVIKDEPPDDNWINPAEENKKERLASTKRHNWVDNALNTVKCTECNMITHWETIDTWKECPPDLEATNNNDYCKMGEPCIHDGELRIKSDFDKDVCVSCGMITLLNQMCEHDHQKCNSCCVLPISNTMSDEFLGGQYQYYCMDCGKLVDRVEYPFHESNHFLKQVRIVEGWD